MSEPRCAHCGEHVAPDSDHVHLVGEIKRMRDRDDREDHYLHVDCWRSVSQGWTNPA